MEPNPPITTVRPFTEDDHLFFQRVVNRLNPAEQLHRDPVAFAANTHAIAFYERVGYTPDLIRMVKATQA